MEALGDDEHAFRVHHVVSVHGAPVAVSRSSYHAFEAELAQQLAAKTVRWRMRYLYNVAIASPDLEVRDYFFENFRDNRTVDELLSEPWWPNIPRVLAAGLHISERRRVLQELDNFFRWRERTRDVLPQVRVGGIFLAEGLTTRTRYQRLSRLCGGLEAVLPRDPDLMAFRRMQSELYAQVWPHTGAERPSPRRIEEVEDLLDRIERARGETVAEATRQNRRAALNAYYDVLAAAGRPLGFEKPSLDLFADYVHAKRAIWKDINQGLDLTGPDTTAGGAGWCNRSAASKCDLLTPFIADPVLKRRWFRFENSFANEAKTRGELKKKEVALARHPMGLNDLFLKAAGFLQAAEQELDVQVRHGLLTVCGALGVLLFYPLRKSDLLGIRTDATCHAVRRQRPWDRSG